MDRDRAAVATVLQAGAEPGSLREGHAGDAAGIGEHPEMTPFISWAWCWAASRGWMPPAGGE